MTELKGQAGKEEAVELPPSVEEQHGVADGMQCFMLCTVNVKS